RLSSQSTSQTEGWVSSPHELELGAAQIAFGFRAPQLAAGSHVIVHTPQIQLSPSSQSFALQSPRKCVSLLDDPPEEAPPQAATRSPAHRAQMLTVFIWYSIFLVRSLPLERLVELANHRLSRIGDDALDQLRWSVRFVVSHHPLPQVAGAFAKLRQRVQHLFSQRMPWPDVEAVGRAARVCCVLARLGRVLQSAADGA